jgi:hypothetical protein
VEKGRWRISEGLCMDRYFVSMGGFGKEVYLKGMDVTLPMHLKGITIQYPLDIFCVVHVMMHIDITVTNRKRLFHFRLNRTGKLFRFLGRWKMIEKMAKVLKYWFNPLRFSAFQVEDQPRALCSPKDVSL